MTYEFHKDHTIPPSGWVWVFGSNTAGRHGAGAAKVAHTNFGAKYGVGFGRTGDAYAVATKGRNLSVLPLDAIQHNITSFIHYAERNPKEKFFVTRIGCDLAGYTDAQIAPLFKGSPPNCSFSQEWKEYL